MMTLAHNNAAAPWRILGLITARGGSKRVPRKNLRPVGGKPLLAWTAEAALASGLLSRVVLSTEDEEIADLGRRLGLEVPFLRPDALARDDSSHIAVVLDALDRLEAPEAPEGSGGFVADAVCLLQPTSPLRTAAHIDGLLAEALRTRPPALTSVCEATQHPYFARRMDDHGGLSPYVEQNVAYPRKQDLPKAYFVNGAIYYNAVASLRADETFYPEGCKGWIMPVEDSLQIDEPFDLTVADLLLAHRKEREPK